MKNDPVPDPITPEALILLPGGRSMLVFAGLSAALPARAKVRIGVINSAWQALSWQHGGQGYAIGLTQAVPTGGFLLPVEGAAPVAIGAAHSLTPDIGSLAKVARVGRGPLPEIIQMLRAHMADVPEREVQELIVRFLDLAADPKGFVEVVAQPETGGLFVQGWSEQPLTDSFTLLTPGGAANVIAASFPRDDVLSPAAGFCLLVKGDAAQANTGQSLYLWRATDVWRLDVVPTLAPPMTDGAASDHIRSMLSRLEAPPLVLEQFKRMCRPRFTGEDTLSQFNGPIAVGLDRALRGAGGVFLTGWMLDPLAQVDMVLVKSSANLHASVMPNWHRLPRADLHDGFRQDLRFAGLLDPRETRNGFLCHIPAAEDQLAGAEIYLELVLHDGRCLFQPLVPALCRDTGAAHAVLNTIPRHDPALKDILARHVAPFLAGLAPKVARGQSAMIPMGQGHNGAPRPVAALMTVADPEHLKPVFAALCDTPEAKTLDLILVLEDSIAPQAVSDLGDQFAFYGLRGGVILCPAHMSQATRLDMAAAAATAPQILLWRPEALPQAPGWLAALRREAETLPAPGLVSPMLCYEDGAIHFGGSRVAGRPDEAISKLAGFNRRVARVPGMQEVSAGAAELALIDRDLLRKVGGFVGLLLGDGFTHHDLAARLRQAQSGAWCASNVEFWMLPSGPAAAPGSDEDFVNSVDAALIAHLSQTLTPRAGAAS